MSSNKTKRRNKVAVAQRAALREAISFDALRDQREQMWNVDRKSFDASFDRNTRLQLVRCARDEVYNNSYAFGAGKALVTSVIGTVPRLQIITECGVDGTDEITEKIEKDFRIWANSVHLGKKLRAMRFSKFVDGESFCVMHGNENVDGDVKLDFTPIDCERVTSNTSIQVKVDDRDIDGIFIDKWGNPVRYRVLDNHPGGSTFGVIGNNDATDYPANMVCHWYNQTASEMRRGIPEITAALKTFAFLRRYIYSVVRAAECAADIAMCIYTDSDDEGGGFVSDAEAERIKLQNPIVEHPFSRGSAVSIPYGMKLAQVKAEQPTSTFEMMTRELLASAGASIGLPAMIILNTARGQSYAGGRMELQEFYRFIMVDQKSCVESVLNPLLKEWLKEWRVVNNVSEEKIRDLQPKWQFDGFEHVDPLKEASAQVYKIQSNTSTLAEEYGKIGKDWLTEVRQRALEARTIKDLEKEYGVNLGSTPTPEEQAKLNSQNKENNSNSGEDKGDDEEE